MNTRSVSILLHACFVLMATVGAYAFTLDKPEGIIIEDVIIQFSDPSLTGEPLETSSSQIDWDGSSSPEYIKAKMGTNHFWIKRISVTQFELLNPLNLSLQVDNAPVSAALVRFGDVVIQVSSDSVTVVSETVELQKY